MKEQYAKIEQRAEYYQKRYERQKKDFEKQLQDLQDQADLEVIEMQKVID